MDLVELFVHWEPAVRRCRSGESAAGPQNGAEVKNPATLSGDCQKPGEAVVFAGTGHLVPCKDVGTSAVLRCQVAGTHSVFHVPDLMGPNPSTFNLPGL